VVLTVAGRRDLPTLFLRAEGAVLLGLATFLYWFGEGSWAVFLVLLLAPDLSILAYIGGSRVGAVVYNLSHTYLLPAVLLVVGIFGLLPGAFYWGLIWFAHIGMDRMLGYGLKHASGFRDTHLGLIGRARERLSAGD
jgi:hypothetical protein